MLHPDELKVENTTEEPNNPPQEPIDVPNQFRNIQRMLKTITEAPDDMTGDKEKRQFNTMLSIMSRIIKNREEGKIEADLPMRDRDPPPEPTGPVTEDHIKLKKAQLGIEALASKFEGDKEKAIFLGTRGALAKLVAAKVPSSCEVEPVKSFEEANQLLKTLNKDFIGDKKDQNKVTSATQMLSGYINKLHRESNKSFYPPPVGKHRFGGGGFRGSRGRGRGGGFRGRGGFRGGRSGFRGGRSDRGRSRGGRGGRGGGRSRGRSRGRGRSGGFGGSRRGGGFNKGGYGGGRDQQKPESSFAGPRGGSSTSRSRGSYGSNPYGGGHNSNPYGGGNQKQNAYGHGGDNQSYGGGHDNYGSSHKNNSYGGAYGGGHSNDNTQSNEWH